MKSKLGTVKRLSKLSLVAFGVVALSSCATILSGKTQQINVTSTGKSGVEFRIDGKTEKTPAAVTVERENKDKVIEVLDKQCSQKEVVLQKKINPVFFANIFIGGSIGSTTDYATNAMWEYDNNVQIQCK